MKTKTKIISIIGGPGVGKSTIASGVYYTLKTLRYSCELVTEVAKDITYEETHKLLENQIHVFAEQYRRQWRLLDKVDYVITDCPLILNSIYFDYYLDKMGENVRLSGPYIEQSRTFFDASFLEYNNINFFVQRGVEYDPAGRNQDAHEAVNIDAQIMKKLKEYALEYTLVSGDTRDIVNNIVTVIKRFA